ncbi:MAG: endolytic transglycosylase MltG [Chitinophagaceae bacterium]|nr:endolytic transglycosylase MltG [Chitinophagaceae bacterium]
MIKKIILLFVLLIVVVTAFVAWKLTGSATAFSGQRYLLYIKTGFGFEEVMQILKKDNVLNDPALFSLLAKKMEVPSKLKAGRFEIKKGASLLQVARILRNGKQLPVNLVITKLRTKEDFARLAGRHLECDSLAVISWLNSADSLQTIGTDTNTVITTIIPNTYTFYWNVTASKLMHRLHDEQKKFWTEERLQKARNLGLTSGEVYTLASIIEEETNKYDEMPLIASVYINRLNKRMLLGADPTVKYAARNFAARRVTKKMIDESAASPYNTYRNAGLPPGPICTPSVKTIDAVLNAADTNYLYFCARSDFSGYHAFAATDAEHLKNARAYWKALDSLKIK